MTDNWHTKDIKEIESILQTDIEKGLNEDTAKNLILSNCYF
ncbi:MAG: cation-transporting P-type ATPase [Candidatus Humimicrobiaceae bacterium]